MLDLELPVLRNDGTITKSLSKELIKEGGLEQFRLKS